MTVLYDNIAELVTNDVAQGDGSLLGLVADAAMVVDRGWSPGWGLGLAHLPPIGAWTAVTAARLDAPSYVHLAYRPGVPITGDVVSGDVTAIPRPPER